MLAYGRVIGVYRELHRGTISLVCHQQTITTNTTTQATTALTFNTKTLLQPTHQPILHQQQCSPTDSPRPSPSFPSPPLHHPHHPHPPSQQDAETIKEAAPSSLSQETHQPQNRHTCLAVLEITRSSVRPRSSSHVLLRTHQLWRHDGSLLARYIISGLSLLLVNKDLRVRAKEGFWRKNSSFECAIG